MVCLIAAIVLSVLSQLVGFINSWLAFVLYAIIFLMVPIFMILNIILILDKKGKDPKLFISLILFILFILFSYRGYSLVRAYSEVHKQLDENFNTSYKIVGVTNYEMDSCYNHYKYAFNVKLNDDTNFVFRAVYGSGGMPIATYHVCYDYENYYVPYYLDLFNEEHQSDLIYKIKSSRDSDDIIYIEYSNKNKKLLYEFFEYLYSKDFDAQYQIEIYNTDTKEDHYIASWNGEYKNYIRLDDYVY